MKKKKGIVQKGENIGFSYCEKECKEIGYCLYTDLVKEGNPCGFDDISKVK